MTFELFRRPIGAPRLWRALAALLILTVAASRGGGVAWQGTGSDPTLSGNDVLAAAMFSNAEAPLTTRTVRFISGLHLPPGVPNAPNAALYRSTITTRDGVVRVP